MSFRKHSSSASNSSMVASRGPLGRNIAIAMIIIIFFIVLLALMLVLLLQLVLTSIFMMKMMFLIYRGCR